MALYAYDGKRRSGEPVQGRLEAVSDAAAASELAASGIVPIRISEVAKAKASVDLLARWTQKKIGLDDLIIFSRQMYTMTRAGVPVIRALGGLADTARNPSMERVLRSVSSQLDSGHELGAAMRTHPEAFSNLLVSLVHVGETSGRLEESFMRIAKYLELELDTRRRIKSAMRYPMIVGVAISAALVILNIFVIPAFAGVFASFGADLPWATRVLIVTSGFFVDYWPHMLVVTVGGWFGFRHYVATESGRLWWGERKLRIPGIGSILERSLLSRFARTLTMTLQSGVPITTSRTLVAQAVDNAWVALRIEGMREGIERGEDLTRTAHQSGLFTPLVLPMLAIGEETGNVDELLTEVGEYYEREVDYDLKRIGDLIEPILMVGIGVVVLILALGIYLPMWDLAGAAH